MKFLDLQTSTTMKTPALKSLALAAAFGLTLAIPLPVWADGAGGVVCSYAPSQSKAIAALTGAAGGGAAATSAVAAATGLTAVTHSSGALILTGSGGYVAGTLGAAAAAPAIVTVGVVVGVTAASVELICAPKNHPELVAKVQATAVTVARQTGKFWSSGTAKAASAVRSGTVKVKKMSASAFDRWLRKKSDETDASE